MDMTDNFELIRLLNSGAKPTVSCFPHHLQDIPTDMTVKMFVVGNSGAGKSTFVKSFTTEDHGGLFHLKHQLTKVKDVDKKPAGIIPYDINSKALGRLSIYDFAGHKEIYAGNDTLLHNTMTNSPSIVALVIDMRDDEGKIEETLQYWFQFINNHSSGGGAKPHLLVIGSHADELPSSEGKKRRRALESVVNNHELDGVTVAGEIMIDCRYAVLSSMTKLQSMVSSICQSLRTSKEIAAAHHSLLVFMLHRFRNKLAIKFGDVGSETASKAKQ